MQANKISFLFFLKYKN